MSYSLPDTLCTYRIIFYLCYYDERDAFYVIALWYNNDYSYHPLLTTQFLS